jgi:hypothetical protein
MTFALSPSLLQAPSAFGAGVSAAAFIGITSASGLIIGSGAAAN